MQIDIFLWPLIAILLERRMYDAREPSSGRGWRFWKKKTVHTVDRSASELPEDTAISIRNLNKTFQPRLFHRSQGAVTAISDLSLDIPKFGIFVLLGSNGYVPKQFHYFENIHRGNFLSGRESQQRFLS